MKSPIVHFLAEFKNRMFDSVTVKQLSTSDKKTETQKIELFKVTKLSYL